MTGIDWVGFDGWLDAAVGVMGRAGWIGFVLAVVVVMFAVLYGDLVPEDEQHYRHDS